MAEETRRVPPKKKPGQGIGPRRINGAMLDLHGGAEFCGWTEKAMRGKVERRLVPFRRVGGRIVFIRRELEAFMTALPGCSLDEALSNVHARQE